MRVTGLSRSRPGSTVTRSPPCGRCSADAARPLTRTLGEGGRRCGARCGRRRADHPPPAAPQSPQDLGHGKAGRYRQRVALNGHRNGRALQQPSAGRGNRRRQQPQQPPCATGQPQPGGPGRSGADTDPGRRVWLLILVEPVAPAANDPMTEAGAISAYLLPMLPTGKSTTSRREYGVMRLRLMAARGLGGDTLECPGNTMQHAAWVADWTTSLVAEKAAAARWKERQWSTSLTASWM
jgi:hypothetical protein